jgi:hypothetical protein
MAIVGPYTKEYEYIGLSTDAKPIHGVHLGSKFYEKDTGNTYIWDNASWDLDEIATYNRVWSTSSLSWVAMTQPGGGTGGTVDQGIGGLSPWLVTGPLTDTQLRTTAVPVSISSAITAAQAVAADLNATITGTVSISNFPDTQIVSGSVSVTNFPSVQTVTGDFYPDTQVVSGTVTVGNLPVTQAVTGTFWQETQPVSDDPFSKYKCSDLEEDVTSYYGFIDASGNWFIMQVTSTAIRFCKGTSSYSTNWTGRAGLTYGYYDAIF